MWIQNNSLPHNTSMCIKGWLDCSVQKPLFWIGVSLIMMYTSGSMPTGSKKYAKELLM